MADTPEELNPKSVDNPLQDATDTKPTEAEPVGSEQPEAGLTEAGLTEAGQAGVEQPELEHVASDVVIDATTAEVPSGIVVADGDAAADDQPAEEDQPAGESESESGMPVLDIGGGAPLDADQMVDPDWRPVIRGKVDKFGVAMGTGRRKTSVARVRIKPGDGKIEINGRTLEEYVCVERDRNMILTPLRATDNEKTVDVWIRVKGGGTTGQTGAIVLGIARALQGMQPELHHTLANAGLLTRDSRMVERKKYGLKKARKSFQFSKR